MIAIKELTKQINDGLNTLAAANGFPFVFAVKSEGGEYMPPKRDGNDVTVYINGTTSVVDTDTVPTQGVSVFMQTVKLEIAFPLSDEIPIEQSIAPIRDLLDAFFSKTPLQTFQDDDGKPIVVSLYANIPTTGSIALSTGVGLMCSFSCNIFYNYIENGVNSFDTVILFDGDRIPYMDATITRVPIMEANPYSGSDGVAETVSVATALNIEISAPTLQAANNALFAACKDFILLGDNTPHEITLDYDGTTKTYKMVFGQCALSLEGLKNGNSRISLVQARSV